MELQYSASMIGGCSLLRRLEKRDMYGSANVGFQIEAEYTIVIIAGTIFGHKLKSNISCRKEHIECGI